MPLLCGYDRAKAAYDDAAKRGWVIPCFCAENLTTSEAVLCAAEEFARENGFERVPVTVAITVRYPHRSQASYYTNMRRWDLGLKLFTADLGVLAGSDAFSHVDVLTHLDHVQHDLDGALLEGDLSEYASIMYDASTLPFEQNLEATARFVKRRAGQILIEGACDEIVDATGAQRSELTTPENALRFLTETGADLIVANLGTEHRASGHELHYRGDAARKIRERIGAKIVLHGTSSVSNDELRALYADGVCKVNIWTTLERDSSPALLRRMVTNASRTAGAQTVSELVREGYLTGACETGEKPALSCFTTAARQEVVFQEMKDIARAYFDLWYKR